MKYLFAGAAASLLIAGAALAQGAPVQVQGGGAAGATIPAVPATPATPGGPDASVTPAIPATPAVPADPALDRPGKGLDTASARSHDHADTPLGSADTNATASAESGKKKKDKSGG